MLLTAINNKIELEQLIKDCSNSKDKMILELFYEDIIENYNDTNKMILSTIIDELYSDSQSYDFNSFDLLFFINKYFD